MHRATLKIIVGVEFDFACRVREEGARETGVSVEPVGILAFNPLNNSLGSGPDIQCHDRRDLLVDALDVPSLNLPVGSLGRMFQQVLPTLGQVAHAFELLPQTNDIEWRDRALIAFLMLTGARDGAIASFRLKRIDLIEGRAYQDARDVKTKSSKTFTTWFLPVDPVYLDCLEGWVQHLQNDLQFGHDDPLFPKPLMGHKDGFFAVAGLSRDGYSNANMIRSVVKLTFANAGFQSFTPHSFRKTLVRWADKHYPSREGFKAFSQNIGHSDVVTTISAYCPVSSERQAELIRG